MPEASVRISVLVSCRADETVLPMLAHRVGQLYGKCKARVKQSKKENASVGVLRAAMMFLYPITLHDHPISIAGP